MRRNLYAASVALVAGLLLAPATAGAQFQYQRPVTNPRPALNPILNMYRGSPVVNYYGVVRPQQQTARTLQQLQQEFKELTPALPPATFGPEQAASPGVTTGHPVQFQNTATFFPQAGTRSGGMVGGVQQAAPSTTGILRR